MLVPIERIEAGIHWQRQLACRLVNRQDQTNAHAVACDLENLLREMIDMARTNQQNLQVVLGALTDAKNKAISDDQKAALDGLKTAAQDITPDPEPAAAEAGK